MLSEGKVREIIKEEIDNFSIRSSLDGYEHHLSFNEGLSPLITEGVSLSSIKPIIKHIIQWMIAGAAEYGIVIGTFGAGAAGLAETVETIIDVLFFAGDIGYLVASLNSSEHKITNISKEMKEIIERCKKTFKKHPLENLDKFYVNIRAIVRKVFKVLGKESQIAVHGVIEAIKSELVTIGSYAADAIKVVIPDATIGLGIAFVIHAVTVGSPQVCYTAFSKGLQVAGKFLPWILKPEEAMKFFEEAYPKIIEVFRSFEVETEKSGIAEIEGLSENRFSDDIKMRQFIVPAMFGWVADLLEEEKDKFFWVLDKILYFAIPNFLMNLALLQIFMREEYTDLDFDETVEPDKKTKPDNDDENDSDGSTDYDNYPEDSAGPDAYPDDTDGLVVRGSRRLSENRDFLLSLERDISSIESMFIRISR
jgi:hypothetical protein